MEFKIGDWVEVTYYTGKRTIAKVSSKDTVQENGVGQNYSTDLSKDWKLWSPRDGEWCWVDDSLCICTKVTKENTFIVENSTRGTIEATLNAVEPFIGTLPTFVKEK